MTVLPEAYWQSQSHVVSLSIPMCRTKALLPLMAAQGVVADEWMVADLALVGLHAVR